MAFTGNYTCNTFLSGLMDGNFNFGAGTTDTFYIALYTNAASLSNITTEYTSDGEVVAAGYAPQALTIAQVPVVAGISPPTSYISFSNVSWNAALTARGALIYKPGANGAICVLDFGNDKSSGTVFTVQFPAATNTSAIIRIS